VSNLQRLQTFSGACEGGLHLEKPTTESQLLAAVEELLDHARLPERT
jgi:hypothetical protein